MVVEEYIGVIFVFNIGFHVVQLFFEYNRFWVSGFTFGREYLWIESEMCSIGHAKSISIPSFVGPWGVHGSHWIAFHSTVHNVSSVWTLYCPRKEKRSIENSCLNSLSSDFASCLNWLKVCSSRYRLKLVRFISIWYLLFKLWRVIVQDKTLPLNN